MHPAMKLKLLFQMAPLFEATAPFHFDGRRSNRVNPHNPQNSLAARSLPL